MGGWFWPRGSAAPRLAAAQARRRQFGRMVRFESTSWRLLSWQWILERAAGLEELRVPGDDL
jgi:hypothetical protein